MSQDKLTRCRDMVNSDGARAVFALLEDLIEAEKERLVSLDGDQALMSRGFIVKTRQALKSVRASRSEKKRNTYAA